MDPRAVINVIAITLAAAVGRRFLRGRRMRLRAGELLRAVPLVGQCSSVNRMTLVLPFSVHLRACGTRISGARSAWHQGHSGPGPAHTEGEQLVGVPCAYAVCTTAVGPTPLRAEGSSVNVFWRMTNPTIKCPRRMPRVEYGSWQGKFRNLSSLLVPSCSNCSI